MAMRSQVWDWDLYYGTPVTGSISGLIIGDGGTKYATGDFYPTTAITGTGTGALVGITSVDAVTLAITGIRIDAGGSGYVVGDKITIATAGDPCTLQVTSITPTLGTRFITLGEPFSLFIEKGNRLKNKPMTKSTQFIVVENFGCTPTSFFPGTNAGAGSWDLNNYRGSAIRNSLGGPRAYLQFYINTTGYFKDPDGVARDGIPGNVAPYPLTEQFNACNDRVQTPVYILPTQTWDLKMTCYNDNISNTGSSTNYLIPTQLGQLKAFFKYTLYDGVDCLIALKLLEQNIKITPENVDTFKKNLFSQNVQVEASEPKEQ